jgi:hypothetical protein
VEQLKGRQRVYFDAFWSLVLVIASGLLVRSASTIQRGTHFDPEHVILIRLRPELLKYSPQQIETLLKAVDQRLSLTPGVKSVAFMEGGEGLVWYWRSGRDVHVSVSGQTTVEDAVPTVLKQGVSGPVEQLPKTPFHVNSASVPNGHLSDKPTIWPSDEKRQKCEGCFR